jgi:agmatinase
MPKNELAHLPYLTGSCSFCRAMMVDNLDSMPGNARIAFLGIPFDGGTLYRPGSRFGPRSIREASIVYGSSAKGFGGFYDVEVGRVLLTQALMVDVGDVSIVPSRSDLSYENITAAVGDLIDRGLFLVSAGGDHSVSFPIIRAHASRRRINVVQFDTHLDFIQIGIRGLLNSPLSHMSAIAAGNIVVTTQDLRKMGAEQTMQMVPPGDCYVTIDIDLFDPSVAPGTGTPEPGGLSYDEMKALLATLAGRHDIRIRGFDLVEVNPLLDYNGTTALLASRVILDFLGLILDEDGPP